jgi:RNA ligase
MHYEFPKIEHISDVLPHIEGRPEFVVNEKDDYKVINYHVAFEDSFHMEGRDDLTGAIRRECRGLIFNARTGDIISRPFHKFFNVNERTETQTCNIDLSHPHIIMEKMDGSMVRPIVTNGKLILATKAGKTDIGDKATEWLNDRTMIAREWIWDLYNRGYTPIFEWVAPDNRIVIRYDEPNLVLLAIRENRSGQYQSVENPVFELPQIYGTVEGSLDKYVKERRQDKDREGFVLRFVGGYANGHMFKGKNDWYVDIHKTKDEIRTDRHVLKIILKEELDDLLPFLDEIDLARVLDIESRFKEAFVRKMAELETLFENVKDKSKKEIAIEVLPGLENKEDGKFLFSMADGKELRELMLNHCRSSATNTAKYDRMKIWLGM